MGAITDQLTAILSKYDESQDPLDESTIYTEINSLASEKLEAEEAERLYLMAETMAFGFIEDYQDKRTGWDTYFGPLAVLPDESGRWYETPSIRLVTAEILDYWLQRAQQAKNPVLKMRYADLVWDFTRKVTGSAPDIQAAQTAIGSALEIVQEKRFGHESFAVKKLNRALTIALGISDPEQVQQAISTIIALEDEIGQDTNIGLWGFSFDTLMKNKKIPLTEEQRSKIISDLEARLQRFITNPDYSFSVYAAENAAMRLVQFYQKQNDHPQIHRVLRAYGNLVVESVEQNRALAGLASVEKLWDIYFSHGMRKDAEALAPLLEKLGKRTDEEMQTMTHEIKVPTEELEKYYAQFLDKSLEEALIRIAVKFVPEPEKIETQVKDLAKEAPLTFLITHSLMDRDGRTIARIGSIEVDLDGHIIYQTSQNLQFESPFLNELFKRTFSQYQPSLEDLMEYLYQSPIFQAEDRFIIQAGIEAYRQENHLVAAHLLIPQIENILRFLLQTSGGSIYKPGRNGGMFLKTLDEILREEVVRIALGNDVAQYLQILLTDPRGWNARNNVCHGMAHPSLFGPVLTDRLFHVLLVLALIRNQPPAPEG